MIYPHIDRIEQVLSHESTPSSNLDKVRAEDIQELKASYPGIPDDYLEFLRRIGAGSILNSSYAIYTGPVEPSDIFGKHDATWPKDLLVFGDNFSGDVGVFLPSKKWQVGELWHDDRSLNWTGQSFSAWMLAEIRSLLGEDEA